MQTIHGFDFLQLRFDEKGQPLSPTQLGDLKQQAQATGATDAIFIAHGFRNDENEALNLYTNFLGNFRAHLNSPAFAAGIGARKYIVAGVFWPSKAFKETFKDPSLSDGEGTVQSLDPVSAEFEAARQQLEEMRDNETRPDKKEQIEEALALLPDIDGDPAKQDEFVSLVLSLLDNTEIDPTEGLEQIQSKSGSELLEALRTPIILPTASASDGDGGVASFDSSFVDEDGSTQGIGSFVSSIFGRVGQFLNMTTWYLMKDRSGNVGKNGVADAVRDFKKNLPAVKVHLVGHSLGGRLMAACAKQLSVNPLVQADSLTLLQAAFSHFGLSSDRSGRGGFFQDVMAKKVVRGPMVATFSNKDKVVGLAYALASRLAGDTTKAVGDANDPFGGIGRNGAQNANGVSQTDLLHAAGSAYSFPLGVVNCLDGSNNLINSHGDVTSPAVTYAFASAVAQT